MSIKIELEVDIPNNIEESDISDWIEHTYLNCGTISMDNPLFKLDPELINFKWERIWGKVW